MTQSNTWRKEGNSVFGGEPRPSGEKFGKVLHKHYWVGNGLRSIDGGCKDDVEAVLVGGADSCFGPSDKVFLRAIVLVGELECVVWV